MKKMLVVILLFLVPGVCSAGIKPMSYQWVDSSDTARYEVDVNNVGRSRDDPNVIVFADKVINYRDNYISYSVIVANMATHEFSVNAKIYRGGIVTNEFHRYNLIYIVGSYLEEEVLFASRYAHTIGDE